MQTLRCHLCHCSNCRKLILHSQTATAQQQWWKQQSEILQQQLILKKLGTRFTIAEMSIYDKRQIMLIQFNSTILKIP